MIKIIPREQATVTCVVSYVIKGAVKTYTGKINFIAENLNYEQAETENEEASENVKKAAQELNKLENALNLSYDLVNRKILSKEQLEAIEKELLCQMVMMSIPQKDLKDELKEKLMKKIFGEYKISVSGYSKEIVTTIVIESAEYGELKIAFKNNVSKYNYDSYDVGSFGSITYEITGGKGLEKVPENYRKGFAGGGVTADVSSFLEAASQVAQDAVKNLYDSIWGNKANEAADLIFNDSVKNIIKNSKYKSFSNIVYSSMTAPVKKYVQKCPVNIYVYDSEGIICAAVEDQEVKLTCEEVDISIDGDTKTVLLYDDSYTIKTTAMAKGEMQIIVEEYANSSDLIRTVVFDNIVLADGTMFLHEVNNDFLGDISAYAITSSEGEEILPDSDIGYIHNHKPIEWVEEIKATCTITGKYISECSVCERIVVDFREGSHTFTEKIIDSAHLASAATTQSPAIYKYDCANCDAISEDLTFTHGEKLNVTLGKPAKITTVQNTSAIRLTWTPVENATGYRVFLMVNGAWKTLATGTTTSYLATNLKAGTKYTFAVRAYLIYNNKVYWAPQFSTLETATTTIAPAKVASVQNTSAIKLAWTACPGATGYRVFFKVNGAWKTCLNATTATSHTFTRLPAGTTYTFAVRPYTIVGGVVIWSNFTEYTAATLPLAPTVSAVSAAKGKATVSWSEVNGAEAYQVYYRMGNGSYKLFKPYVSPQKLNFTLYSNTKYTFAVRAAKRTSAGWVYGAFTFVNVVVK